MSEPRVVILSPAQRAVVGELAHDGASSADIADRLGIDVVSVRNHIRQALNRSGCRDRVELLVLLLRGRIVIRTQDRRRKAA